MTDSKLRQVFRKGFPNPQHLEQLLKRTDLPKDRQISVRTNLAQAYNSGQIQSSALQRFISQLSKAKSLKQFDQVLAELRHANRLIESGMVAKNSLVFVSAPMKNITGMPARSTLPKELFNLPQPWGMTHPGQRRQEIRSLRYNTRSIKTALNVLQRSLHSLSQLTLSETDCIPEDMITYWGVTAEWLAFEIPTLDDFSLVKVEEFLISEQRIDSPSPELIFDVAEYWVWWVTKGIEKAALNWVEDALMKNRDLNLISRFILIAERYWQKIEPPLAESLLSASAMIARQKALPLLESVEQNPFASEEVKETARNYRRYVYKHREKWLPDDVKEEIKPQASQRVEAGSMPVLQPALGQLAYAWGHPT